MAPRPSGCHGRMYLYMCIHTETLAAMFIFLCHRLTIIVFTSMKSESKAGTTIGREDQAYRSAGSNITWQYRIDSFQTRFYENVPFCIHRYTFVKMFPPNTFRLLAELNQHHFCYRPFVAQNTPRTASQNLPSNQPERSKQSRPLIFHG